MGWTITFTPMSVETPGRGKRKPHKSPREFLLPAQTTLHHDVIACYAICYSMLIVQCAAERWLYRRGIANLWMLMSSCGSATLSSRLGGDENQVCASNTSSDSACVFKGRSAPSVSPTSESHGIKREDFRQNMNGSWTPIRKVAPSGSNGPFSVEPDQMLGIGPSNRASVYGVKMARTLNDQCR